MAAKTDLLSYRESLDRICKVPDEIISVYSLEQHVWADGNSPQAIRERRPNLTTIAEFQIGPVLHFLNDIFRQMAAPYRPESRENPIGQGYWIQAEFGSGKSHLLCFLAAMTLGSEDTWQIALEKERQAGRGKSIYAFWENGLQAKSTSSRGIFVISRTLIGHGGKSGGRLVDIILRSAKEQLQKELGKNISLYPAELLAERFLHGDLERYRMDLGKFLRDPRFFAEDEQEDLEQFLKKLQDPSYKEACGNKLWRFYDEYLRVLPILDSDLEDILAHMVRAILAEGYCGVLLLLDEISLFMKDRDDKQRSEDETTLVVLSNRLTRALNLPIWTVCTAQQAIMSKMSYMNIIAEDRLKLVPLLRGEKDYYEIVLSRVREIARPDATASYYSYYKKGFTWPTFITEDEFLRFFPFHKPAIEVLRSITYELTTTRSAIHFMHQTLKHHMKEKRNELIRLWDFFDEALTYEEDPSGTYAAITALKARRDTEYRVYESCRKQIDSATKGMLKVYRDRSVKVLQVLFLNHIAKILQQGMSPEEIANSVLIERSPDSIIDENIQHYESLADALSRELPQVVRGVDDENRPRFSFKPQVIDDGYKRRFEKAKIDAESSEQLRYRAWEHLLALEEWPVTNRQMTFDLAFGTKSIFKDISPFVGGWENKNTAKHGRVTLTITWQNREIQGNVEMIKLDRALRESIPLPGIESSETDQDFAVFVGIRPMDQDQIQELLSRRNDPRIIIWTPDDLTPDEKDKLIEFAAYRTLVSDYEGKDSDEAMAAINWVAMQLRDDVGRIYKIVESAYARGRMDAMNNSQMEFNMAGEMEAILQPIVDRVLRSVYESKDIRFEGNLIFTKEYAVNVINGLVRTGRIPKNAKQDKNVSAALNFGPGLKIVRKDPDAIVLDIKQNRYALDILHFISEKGEDGRPLRVDAIYKNFMGIIGPDGKSYGLARRMVQIYLLALVSEGKISIRLGPRSGQPEKPIDYSSISEFDFNAKTLDSLYEVHLAKRPENWDILRPYAEKLLGHDVLETQDDSLIATYRKELRELFRTKKDESIAAQEKAEYIFSLLHVDNPYKSALAQMVALFSQSISDDDDIDSILRALSQALGYEDKEDSEARADQKEIDDLANRLKDYDNLKNFLAHERDLETFQAYISYDIPDMDELLGLKEVQKSLAEKIKAIKPYVDSEVRLKAEILGTGQQGESGTLSAMIRDYSTLYTAMHDNLNSCLEEAHQDIDNILNGDELKALGIMEKIAAMPKGEHDQVKKNINKLAEGIFSCPNSSRASVDRALRTGPIHDCGITFANAIVKQQDAELLVNGAGAILEESLARRMEILLSPGIQERLQQGKGDHNINSMLGIKTVQALSHYLVPALVQEPSLVDSINKYLKKIVVKQVKISDFKPGTRTVEQENLVRVVSEFREFLEKQLTTDDADSRPMIQLE